ncbi:MAG: hypothetical protein KAG89_21010 [Fulvimarina manganoxydans]|uniref:hypothetical protein n=1 Tax=Fulvimarina manganoxydans TaxID=937218 RepID=UPI0023551175|nr:hypothetical protein [Fulvimarina manganoxydans]MCK5934629.1 hypothetical protein [Fulvimarina manganoxydans]
MRHSTASPWPDAGVLKQYEEGAFPKGGVFFVGEHSWTTSHGCHQPTDLLDFATVDEPAKPRTRTHFIVLRVPMERAFVERGPILQARGGWLFFIEEKGIATQASLRISQTD